MTLRYSDDVRNAGLDARVAAIGPSPTLRICGSKKTIVEISLPKEWMGTAKNGITRKQGLWAALSDQKGTATRFEICDRAGNTCISGDIPTDMVLDKPDIEVGQSVMVGVFVLVAGNGMEKEPN
jgi:hypothetical protein